MLILGLDLSSTISGWAIIDGDGNLVDYGELRLKDYKKVKNKPLDPILFLFNSLVSIFANHQIDLVAVEAAYVNPKFGQHTIKALAKVRGVAELAAAYSGFGGEFDEYLPSQSRLIAMGDGALKSDKICTILEMRFNRSIATPGFDQTDAIVVALCRLQVEKDPQCLQRLKETKSTRKSSRPRSKQPAKQTKKCQSSSPDEKKKSKS